MLDIDNLDVSRSTLPILWGISFRISEGEMVTLIGPNGAGKTTLVETIFGLNPATRGSIRFQGDEVRGLSPPEVFKRGIALVPEKRELFPKMTVLENLRIGAAGHEDWEKTLEYCIGLFPVLGERRTQLAGTLSGGEQQMVAIGRALMSEPALLVLDEPSTGLSPRLVGEVFRSLERLGREGKTILLLEQNVRHALELCDRGYVMEQGRIIREGKTKELLRDEHIQRAYLGV